MYILMLCATGKQYLQDKTRTKNKQCLIAAAKQIPVVNKATISATVNRE